MRQSIFAGLFSLAILSSAAADYRQSPGHFGGFDSDNTIAVADEFVFDQDTAIKAVSWWGGHTDDASVPDDFAVRIFADNGGQPGALLADLPVAGIQQHRTGNYVNGESPRRFGMYREYHYRLTLTAPLALKGGAKYWLSIVNRSETWLWEASNSPLYWGVQRALGTDPIYGPWVPYLDNTAFELETVKGAGAVK